MANTTLPCFDRAVSPDELWISNETPLLNSLPRLVLQMALALTSNLLFLSLLGPFGQPRIVVDLISAFAISPTVLELANTRVLNEIIWPRRSKTILSMFANIGLLYATFIEALQMDLTPVSHRRGVKTLFFSAGVIVVSFAVGSTISTLFSNQDAHQPQGGAVFVYWGAIMASSCFQTVASIVARLKLLCTEIGRSSLCIGMITNLGSWVFMVAVIALSAIPPAGDPSWEPFATVLVFTALFSAFCFTVVRPLIFYAIRHNKEGENFSTSAINIILFTVLAAGLLAELCGAYAFLGGFILGLAVPHGVLSQTLADRMDDCVSGFLMPLYYVYVMIMMRGARFASDSLTMNVMLVVIAVWLKPFCVFLVAIACRVPYRHGLAVSVLLNCKGLLSVIIVSIGFERGHLNNQAVTMMIAIILASTMVVEPTMQWAYNRMMKNTKPYDNRVVDGLKDEDEFRVVSCVQSSANIPGMLRLLDTGNVSHVFALHLVELIGSTYAMLIVHDSNADRTSPFYSKTRAQSDQMVAAFQNYHQKHAASTSVQTLTIVSALDTMHEDICNVAEDKQVSMILLPFHKPQGVEDDVTMAFRTVNQNVMGYAPCTVGLLVDRGIGTLSPSPHATSSVATRQSGRSGRLDGGPMHVVMLFFGGPDDREALSYAGRLANHDHVILTLTRFVAGSNPVDVEPIIFPGDEDEDKSATPTVYTEHEAEKKIENHFIQRFLEKRPVEYVEMASNSGTDTVAMLKEMDHGSVDLYVVGRGLGVLAPTTAGLIEWSELPELGAIGDVLVTSDFAAHVSVLVVQQYAAARNLPPKDVGVIDFH